MDAVTHADAIALLGYRFPPTDSLSRMRLLSAIRANQNSRVPISVVLGPVTTSPDAQRLRSLLLATGKQDVRLFPMGAEDFIGILSRDEVKSHTPPQAMPDSYRYPYHR